MPDVNINEVICMPGSERGILSIILNNGDKILECETNELFAEHFSVPGHQYLYSAICYLYTQPAVTQIDSLLLYNTITDPSAKEAVNTLGGMQYIDSLMQGRIADNLLIYIEQVKTQALKRMIYNMGEEFKQMVLNDESNDIEEMLDSVQRKTIDLVLSSESEEEVYKMGDSAEDRLRQRAEHPTSIPGLVLGWQKYDKITQGQKGNELTVCVAPSKTGKSTWLLNHSWKYSVIDQIPGIYIDTEMNDEEQEDRLLAIVSGVPYEEIVNGMFSVDTEYGTGREKYAALMNALRQIKDAPLYHIYMPNFTIDKVSAMIRKYHLQKHIGYAIFDYIKLPTSEIAGLATAQEYQRLGYFTTCLKDLSGICNIPVITAAQSNRTQIGNSDMDENSIGGSYRILQMATRLIFLRNKTDVEMLSEGMGSGNLKMKIAFQRNGACSNEWINMAFDRPILRIKECQ
jgi:replicative DNA helicase